MTVFGYEEKDKLTSKLEFKKLHTSKTPTEIFSILQNRYDYVYLLESVVGPQKLAEYSFLGFEPQQTVILKNKQLTMKNTESGGTTSIVTDDPLKQLRTLTKKREVKDQSFRFAGGAVGYLSYDTIRYWEELSDNTTDDSNYPDAEFALYDDGIVFNHQTNEAYYYHLGKNRSADINLNTKLEEPIPLTYSNPKRNITQQQYEEIVLKAKDYITDGDIFQTVLSQRVNTTLKGDPHIFYNILRKINPSAYMYHLKMGERRIIGSSPEMLVRTESKTVETFPIAGTRPRTTHTKTNQQLKEELLADPKDRAEHIMLVDLGRNDLGKISNHGTVKTTEFMQVHQYSHVQHIVSHVVGNLKPQHDSYDAIRAVFPAGTVSGAPKVRAMEIIDELETTRRGPYAGAVGYFSYNGNSDFAIAIRTLTTNRDQAYIQAGAGIVADSQPTKEWCETKDKAAGLINALKIAEEVSTK